MILKCTNETVRFLHCRNFTVFLHYGLLIMKYSELIQIKVGNQLILDDNGYNMQKLSNITCGSNYNWIRACEKH